jgi:hypothetical protein
MADIGTLGTIATAIGVVIVAVLRFRDAQERRSDRKEDVIAVAAAETAAKDAKVAAESSNAALAEIDGKIYKLTEQVDGKLAALLNLTREAALAKGRLEGAATEKADAAASGGRREADDAAKRAPRRASS